MEIILCGSLIGAVILFFYLLNTARKKTATPAAGKKDYTPVYLSIADDPDAVIQRMDKFAAEIQKTESAGDRWRWVPMMIFFAGLGLMGIDGILLVTGYTSFVFSAGGISLWLAAFVMARGLRKSDSHDFSPRYAGMKQILHTLRDDRKPQSSFLGHLDLTGAMLNTKVARETKDAQDRTIQHFRDEWLALKAKLYDGNILRVSAIQKSKKRKPYWKRSRISGKMKMKPEKYKGAKQFLKVRIAVNPELYQIVPIVIAIILVCLVMAVAGAFSFSGAVTAQKFGGEVAWSQGYGGAESMKVINVMGNDQEELFIQNTSNVSVYDGNGAIMLSLDYSSPKTTLGDVDGDGMEDIIVYYVGTGMAVDVIRDGQATTLATNLEVGFPSRVALIRFASGTQIVLGDSSGRLLSLSLEGEPLWTSTLGGNEVRGMDDARVGGQVHLATATNDGNLAVYDAQGKQVWSQSQEILRRLRAFDLNSDGNSEIITGGEYGAFFIYSAADGSSLFSTQLGQAVSEVREVELDGDPSSREIVAGGKEGGVWAFSNTGDQLWSGSLSDKVNEISGIDIDGDGKQEAVIGSESGEVAIFTENGSRNNLSTHNTPITRIDVGRLGTERYVVIADGTEVQVEKINSSSIPGFQYTPLIVGLIVSAIILVIAGIMASIPPKPELKVSFQSTSRESLEAQRRMLKESIADVERLRKSGEVTGDAYLARLKRLRADLAENEAAFKAQGYPIKVETIQCPNCGGTLELGMDKCEYCGQVLLS